MASASPSVRFAMDYEGGGVGAGSSSPQPQQGVANNTAGPDVHKLVFTPVTIYCAAERFQTTFETLLQFPDSQLHRLFSDPYPIYDEHNQAHMLPVNLCPDPTVFSCILEFLRTGQWIMPADDDLYNAVCTTAAKLEIPARPPQLLGGGGFGGNQYRYEHQMITLPVPMRGGGGSGAAQHHSSSPSKNNVPPPYDPTMNTAGMLTILGYKGFAIVAEEKGPNKFTTEVTLRRKLPNVRGVEMLANDSPLFQRLLNII